MKEKLILPVILFIIFGAFGGFIVYQMGQRDLGVAKNNQEQNEAPSSPTTATSQSNSNQPEADSTSNPPDTTYIAASNHSLLDQCTTDMATTFHIHPHITIIDNGKNIEIPANIGINTTTNCMSSIHTHETDGIIHVESPVQRNFILGDFFYNWKKTFNKDQILDRKADATHEVVMTVDGKPSTEFENLVLKDKQEIVIEYKQK